MGWGVGTERAVPRLAQEEMVTETLASGEVGFWLLGLETGMGAFAVEEVGPSLEQAGWPLEIWKGRRQRLIQRNQKMSTMTQGVHSSACTYFDPLWFVRREPEIGGFVRRKPEIGM